MEDGGKLPSTLEPGFRGLSTNGYHSELTVYERLQNFQELIARLPESLRTELLPQIEYLRKDFESMNIDPITGLSNRAATWKYLLWSVKKSCTRGMGIIYCDIDDFRQFNEVYGHPGGDKALLVLGKILSKEGRESEMIGRCGEGSDEFMAILSSANAITETGFKTAALRIFGALNDRKKQRTAGYRFRRPLRVSVGCVWVEWDEDAEQRNSLRSDVSYSLYRSVDDLMRKHKAWRKQQNGKGGSERKVPYTCFHLHKGRLLTYSRGYWP